LTGGASSQSGSASECADPESVARSICLQLLSARPRTRSELAKALSKRQVPDAAAAGVLDRFCEVGLIDDEAFANAWVDSRQAGRKLARSALAGALQRRGVERALIDRAIDRVDPDQERAAALALVTRRLPSVRDLPLATKQRRLLGLLARRGYPAGMAAGVVRDVLAAGTEPTLTESARWRGHE
jgi:regulatory protein